jgi:hypothetical protein
VSNKDLKGGELEQKGSRTMLKLSTDTDPTTKLMVGKPYAIAWG